MTIDTETMGLSLAADKQTMGMILVAYELGAASAHQWRPIETAPLDGKSTYLIYGKDEDNIFCTEACYYDGESWHTGRFAIEGLYWLPLPPRPKELGQDND